MKEQFSRTQILLGEAAVEKLKNARVAVFGVGGVGGYTVEALAYRHGALYIIILVSDRHLFNLSSYSLSYRRSRR